MSSGRLCSKKRTTPGCGWPCAARHDRWWRMPWAIAACRTDQRLYEAIPEEYRQGHCFTDFWAAYAAVIPEEQHTAVGKETGETAHVERWNNTVRQRLARFVRMTLSFSRVGNQARGLSAPLSSSLQYRAGHPAHVSHYPSKPSSCRITEKSSRCSSSSIMTIRPFIVLSSVLSLCDAVYPLLS
jgi:IS1 family transposase